MRAWLLLLMILASTQAQFQPETWEPSNYTVRSELTGPGTLEGAQRVLRFVQISDAHILDDDAPYPMRQEVLDPYITFFSTSAQRPHEEYTDEVLNANIIELNALHAEDAFSFVINTGDNIDNQQENELMRFLDNFEGTITTKGPISGFECVPDGAYAPVDDASNDEVNDCTSLPAEVAANNTALAAGLPWYSAFGNHDSMVQGNVPIEPSFQDIAASAGRFLVNQPDFVSMHFKDATACQGSPLGSLDDDMGHGFGYAGDRLCDESPDNDGYYAFSESGVRFIVLDTINDDFISANSNFQGMFTPEETVGYDAIGGYAEGALDPEQYAWMQLEIETHSDKLIIISAHHTVNSMFTEVAADYCEPGGQCLDDLVAAAGFVTGKELTNYFNTQPNVVAFMGGHTHQHRIQDKETFWNIETSSLIDRPQESRIIEVWQAGDKGFLRLDRVGHNYQPSKDLLATDDQQSTAQDGENVDRDVLLWFDIPSGVSLTPQPDLPRNFQLSFTAEIGLGEQQLALQAQDSRTGLAVPGLAIKGDLSYAKSTETITLLPPGTPMLPKNGTYVWNVTISEARTHYATLIVEDPNGLYPDTTRVFSINVAGSTPGDEKSTPLPIGLAILALAIVLRQKR